LSEPDYLAINRERWTRSNEEYTGSSAIRGWLKDDITWGVFGVPEAELAVLGNVEGLDVVELGCGTAYFAAWLARRGARPVGVDITQAQLETARACMAETGIQFPLIEASAENVPLPDASFDLAISEHGASTWCDPYRWIPEAAGFCGRAAASSSCTPHRSRSSAGPTSAMRRPSSSDRTSACTASSGHLTTASSSRSRTGSGSMCCSERGFRSKG